MDCSAYLDKLSQRYKSYFDVHSDYELLGEKLDIFAEFRVHSEKFFLVKSVKVFSFDNFEYCLVKCFNHEISINDLDNYSNYLINVTNKIVKPNSEHMSTFLSGIIISEKGFSQEVIAKAQKFKYSKDFLFTLKGWCDVRLILVDLARNDVITNSSGKKAKGNYILTP
jgi:hypothetical protein